LKSYVAERPARLYCGAQMRQRDSSFSLSAVSDTSAISRHGDRVLYVVMAHDELETGKANPSTDSGREGRRSRSECRALSPCHRAVGIMIKFVIRAYEKLRRAELASSSGLARLLLADPWRARLLLRADHRDAGVACQIASGLISPGPTDFAVLHRLPRGIAEGRHAAAPPSGRGRRVRAAAKHRDTTPGRPPPASQVVPRNEPPHNPVRRRLRKPMGLLRRAIRLT